MGGSSERRLRVPKNPDTERRASTRYPVTLEVRYATPGRDARVEMMGSGRTIDVSSSGLRFTADRPLLTGQKLEVSIDWPVLLGGDVKLQLVIAGVVVRTNGTEVALQIQRHDFRTRCVRQRAAAPQEPLG